MSCFTPLQSLAAIANAKNADLRIYAKWSRKSFRNFIFQADDFRLFYYNFMSYVQFFNHVKKGYRIGQKYRKLTLAFKENLGS